MHNLKLSDVSQKWSLKLSQGIGDYLKLTGKATVGLSNTIETTKTQFGQASISQLPTPKPGYEDPSR